MQRMKETWIWQKSDWPAFTWSAEKILSFLSQARLQQGKFLAQVSNLGFELGREASAAILTEEAGDDLRD